MKQTTRNSYRFDIALSFAGEDRTFVERVADYLSAFHVRLFYDEWERHKLLGEDLYTYLADLYERRARYCAMFISRHYVRKAWPSHERRFAQARAFLSRRAYILPIRLDHTACPGIPHTVGYINAATADPAEVAVILLRRLGRELYRGDADEIMLLRLMKWQVFWSGDVQARGSVRLLHLGRTPKRTITFNVWSADSRPLILDDLKVAVGRRELRTRVTQEVETSRQCEALLEIPVTFGHVLDYQIRYKCRDYYADVSSICHDSFTASVHMLSWNYQFIFPRNSHLKTFQMLRRVGRNEYRQSYSSSRRGGCPVVDFNFRHPKVGSKLLIDFQLARHT